MPEESSHLWHVSEQGQAYGPYTTEMLQSRIKSGRFTRQALVWRPDFSAWQPIKIHFSWPAESIPIVSEQAAATSSQTVVKTIGVHARWAVSGLSLFSLALLLLVRAVSDDWSPAAGVAIKIVLLVAMAVSGGAAAYLWWRRLQIAPYSPKKVGLVRIAIIFGGTLFAVLIFILAAQMPDIYRVQIARESFRHYTVDVNGGTGTLSIRGLIGPGLASNISQHLKANAAIRIVEIDSIGGLVAEAVKVAKVIERHGDLATRNAGTCNSACVIVFMAGERRIAPVEASFGFHATSAITKLNGVYDLESLTAEGEQAAAYLLRRGVPEKFVSKARAAGSKSIYTVSSVQMANAKAVTHLTRDGEGIGLDEAKWIDLLQRLKRSKVNPALVNLLNTVAELDPSVPVRLGRQSWEALQDADAAKIGGALQALTRPMAEKAMVSSEDEALAEVIEVTGQELTYIRSTGNWKVCSIFLSGKGFVGMRPPENLISSDLKAQAAMFRSAAGNGWRTKPVPEWAEDYGTKMAAQLILRMQAQGLDVEKLDTDPRVSCEWSTALISEIAGKPQAVAAGLYRWLIAQGK